MKIDMYVIPNCPYCEQAKALLLKKGVNYQLLDIKQNSELLREMLKRSNGRKTVPQIFIDDYHVGGCDDLYALERQGQLDSLLHM